MSDSMSEDILSDDITPSPKKRQLSPLPLDDEDKIATKSFIHAPSRIKRKTGRPTENGPPEPTLVEPSPGPTKRIVAPTDPNTTFESLGVSPWLVQSLTNMAITRPTGIQKGCIPEILKGKDCIGWSRTGSGKTVAFAVPILQKLAETPAAIFAVVLTPTRYVQLTWEVMIFAYSRTENLHCKCLNSSKRCRGHRRSGQSF
jgi:ATP-dependent RNA helicase DDX49/DBP8